MAEKKTVVEHGGGTPEVKPAFGKKSVGGEGKVYAERPAIVKITDKKKEK